MSREKKEERGIWLRFLRHLKKRFAAGLLVIIPIGITVFILRFLFNLADGVLAPYIKGLAALFFGKDHYIPGLGMIAGIIVIYVAGIVATNVFGRRLVYFWDGLFSRIPFVNSIYSSAKQLMEVFSKKGRSNFRRAVYVDFPMQGSYSIAFVTNEVRTPSGKVYFTCFVPTAPNPTSGYVLILHESRVYPSSIGVEDAMKIIVSGGIVGPGTIEVENLQ